MILALLLACVPADPPVRSFVDLPAAPARGLVFQTETQAWDAVRETLIAGGVPRLQTATLSFSERVPLSTSEGGVVVIRRFLGGPVLAEARLTELGLGEGALDPAQIWEGWQALAVGSLAYELARVSARDKGLELGPEEEARLAASVERATLLELAARAQIPPSWPDAQRALVCALARGARAAELQAQTRCDAGLQPVPLEELAGRLEAPPLDLFAALAAPDARGPEARSGLLRGDPVGHPLRVEDIGGAVAVTPPDQSWRLEIQPGERPDELRAVLVLPIADPPELHARTLGLVNALNRALGGEMLLVVLSPEGLVFWVSRWPLEGADSPLTLAARLSRLAEATMSALPAVQAGAMTPEKAAEAALEALNPPAPEEP